MGRDDAGGFIRILIPIASVLATACARLAPPALEGMRAESVLGSTQPAGFAVASTGSTRRIGRAELDSVDARNLADAIVQLRPSWFYDQRPSALLRDAAPAVYVNETFVGGLGELRMIPIERVAEVQILTASRGFDRFGGNCRCAAGVILVVSRGR